MTARKLTMTAFRWLLLLFVALVIADVAVDLASPWWVTLTPLVLGYAAVIVGNRWGGTPDSDRVAREPVEVGPPVTGRWSALNSPADRTPSHGTHSYAQTYAIDIVAEPGTPDRARPAFRMLWPLLRRNADFPAFGAPLLAVADATVVHASDGQRDHRARNSLPALVYLMVVEAAVRELTGAHRILGNHLILDLGDGRFALYAHLRQGSLGVRAGDRVRAGQVVAQCGDSGNSTEPHLHFQLMDGPDPVAARGIPFQWRGVGVPRNRETFEVPEAQEVSETSEVPETSRATTDTPTPTAPTPK
ncbi:M23 family metallopeptidase [Streptomyces sp. NPDC048290]|uniref:M23 family metallopeptidase n=1 Tax=Streptomyces sp. NPDC048290 TaxID=3155811 RepID=UPI00344AB34A